MIIELKGIEKSYQVGKKPLQVLKGITPPTFTLPTKRPKWLTTSDIRGFLNKHNNGVYEGTWLWQFWNQLED